MQRPGSVFESTVVGCRCCQRKINYHGFPDPRKLLPVYTRNGMAILVIYAYPFRITRISWGFPWLFSAIPCDTLISKNRCSMGKPAKRPSNLSGLISTTDWINMDPVKRTPAFQITSDSIILSFPKFIAQVMGEMKRLHVEEVQRPWESKVKTVVVSLVACAMGDVTLPETNSLPLKISRNPK